MAKARGGRRKKSDTVDIKIRMKEPLREAIERSAKERGVSMNFEMTDRLDRSFLIENHDRLLVADVLELAFGPKLGAFLLMMGQYADFGAQVAVWKNAGDIGATRHWTEEPYAFEQMVRAFTEILEAVRPDGEATPPKPFRWSGENLADNPLPENEWAWMRYDIRRNTENVGLRTGETCAKYVLSSVLEKTPTDPAPDERWRISAARMLGPEILKRIESRMQEDVPK
jgi:hypothetical protein